MARTRKIHKAISREQFFNQIKNIIFTQNEEKDFFDFNNWKLVKNYLFDVQKKLLEIEKVGGYVLVEINGVEITTYRLDSYKHK